MLPAEVPVVAFINIFCPAGTIGDTAVYERVVQPSPKLYSQLLLNFTVKSSNASM